MANKYDLAVKKKIGLCCNSMGHVLQAISSLCLCPSWVVCYMFLKIFLWFGSLCKVCLVARWVRTAAVAGYWVHSLGKTESSKCCTFLEKTHILTLFPTLPRLPLLLVNSHVSLTFTDFPEKVSTMMWHNVFFFSYMIQCCNHSIIIC